MSKVKRAAIGFKGIALAEVTENTMIAYKTGAAVPLEYAGKMDRTAKEAKQDLYYDDELYMQIKDITGEDVEIRVAEVPLAQMAAFGLGEFDPTTQTLEGGFSIPNKEYALRCVIDTVSKLPFYFNYRLFEMNGIRFDNFATKGDSITVCEVIITGVFKQPKMASLKPYAVMQLKEDNSNEAACVAFLAGAEEKP